MLPMATILLTGFEPFGGEDHTQSAEIVARLGGSRIGGADVVGVVLPVVYGTSAEALLAAISAHSGRTPWSRSASRSGGGR